MPPSKKGGRPAAPPADVKPDPSLQKKTRPSPAECRAALAALDTMHPAGPAAPDGCDADAAVASVMDSLVRTILSQNTTDTTSMRAFVTLKERFPTWERVRTAAAGDIADAIRAGGLADRKAAVIQTVLNAVHAETGGTSLEHVRSWTSEAVKDYLCAFNGIGPKTSSCVLAFALARPDFPVDTHVHRLATGVLGWAPKAADREGVYTHLNARVPDDIKIRLHVLMVEHGKRCASCGGVRAAGNSPVKGCTLRAAVTAARDSDRSSTGLQSPAPPRKRAGGATPAVGVVKPEPGASPVKRKEGGGMATPGGGRARRRLV